MRHPLSVRDREVLEQALRDIDRIIKTEYPEPPQDVEGFEQAFRWGLGDGFSLALKGVVNAALPGWGRR